MAAARRSLALLLATAAALAGAEAALRLSDWAPGSAADRRARATWIERRAHGSFTLEGLLAHDPELGWVPRPGLRDEPWGRSRASTNAAGFRGAREFDPASDAPRLLVVGDSFAFGDDQPDGATWTARLAAALDGVEVLNAGVPGYGTDQSLLRLERLLPAWRPDAVVFVVQEDGARRAMRRFSFFAKPWYEDRSGPDELVRCGVPVPTPAAVLRGERRGHPLRLVEGWRALRGVGAPPRTAADALVQERHLLRRAAARCDAHGAALLAVWVPNPSFADPGSSRLDEVVLGAPEGWATLSLVEPFRAAAAGDAARLYVPDAHFTDEGAALVAELVRARLGELGLPR